MQKKQLTPPSRAYSDAGRQYFDEPAISNIDPIDYEERESAQSFRTSPEMEIQRSTTSIPRLGPASLRSSRANTGDLPPLEDQSDTEPPLEGPAAAERYRFTVSDADIDMFGEIRQKTMLRAYKEYSAVQRASGEEELVAPVGKMNFDELYWFLSDYIDFVDRKGDRAGASPNREEKIGGNMSFLQSSNT